MALFTRISWPTPGKNRLREVRSEKLCSIDSTRSSEFVIIPTTMSQAAFGALNAENLWLRNLVKNGSTSGYL